jgi:hypothetical protein
MNNNVIKRVISNPDQSVERDFKMSKTSIHDSEPAAAAAASGRDANPRSTADKQLSTDNRTSPVNEELRTKLNERLIISNQDETEKEMQVKNSPDPKDECNVQNEIPRQVSVDGGTTSQAKVPVSTSSVTDNILVEEAEVTTSRTVGAVKTGGGEIMPKRHSGISDRSSGGSLMTKDQWGWFEDVHEGETDGDDKEDLDNENDNKTEGNSSQSHHGTEKKSKLLFHDVDRVDEVVPKKGKNEIFEMDEY